MQPPAVIQPMGPEIWWWGSGGIASLLPIFQAHGKPQALHPGLGAQSQHMGPSRGGAGPRAQSQYAGVGGGSARPQVLILAFRARCSP